MASSIHLRRTEENVDDIRAAEEELGERVGIDGVLAHLNRQAERAPVPGQAVEWGFRWNDHDVALEALVAAGHHDVGRRE